MLNIVSSVAVTVTQAWKKTNLIYMGQISSVTIQQHYCTCCVCGWVLKWVQSCAAVACGAVYAAVLSVLSMSCMTDRCQACHGVPGCCGWDVWGQGEMEVVVVVEEEWDGERVCHFIQAFLFLTRILTPVLSISISRWLTKELLSYRQVHIKTQCVCLYVLEWLAQVLTHKIMPCHRFATSAYPHSDDQTLQCYHSAQ